MLQFVRKYTGIRGVVQQTIAGLLPSVAVTPFPSQVPGHPKESGERLSHTYQAVRLTSTPCFMSMARITRTLSGRKRMTAGSPVCR